MKQAIKASTKPPFFGETTEKDEPFILLAQTLGVWGSPKAFAPPKTDGSNSIQGDLFELH